MLATDPHAQKHNAFLVLVLLFSVFSVSDRGQITYVVDYAIRKTRHTRCGAAHPPGIW